MKIKMKTSILTLGLALGLGSLAYLQANTTQEGSADTQAVQAVALPENQAKALFEPYEAIAAALVEDDLESAKVAAKQLSKRATKAEQTTLAEQAETLAGALDLESARKAFLPLSRNAIKLLGQSEGMFVMTCPMVEGGRWLQDNKKVANPYMGQRMPACGMPEKTSETSTTVPLSCCKS
ncbi:DUF3347 domain-containing protein [Ruficoccus sp. ZRK36]|uniref:DUF3347 domain-containing protein n=1 Tax=Ruficoccus sp. ZRK36 TaxID=2866311 RepID=UPI001C72D72F|nr:DUF3347 domain-containing protein [Ruficoccus sp. ZRK36]QYY35498.1 DUF3347 domain-containing protein [Ruficoccus sp. ZRK36]